jgi:phosphate uptake regulator
MAKLGVLYSLREARRDALSQLRDAVSALQAQNDEIAADGLRQAREAVDRLEAISQIK